MDRFLATVSGSTMPGNSTRFRTGRRIRASSGIGGEGGVFCLSSFAIVLHQESKLTKVQQQATVGQFLPVQFKAPRRQLDAALETPVGDFQAVNVGRAEFSRH